jgi:hypothetical protein
MKIVSSGTKFIRWNVQTNTTSSSDVSPASVLVLLTALSIKVAVASIVYGWVELTSTSSSILFSSRVPVLLSTLSIIAPGSMEPNNIAIVIYVFNSCVVLS